MNSSFLRSAALCVLACGSFAAFSGCASSPDAESTVESMGSFGVEVAKIKDSIDGTIKTLEAVMGTQPGDLHKNFDAYSKAVKSLDKQADHVRHLANEMKVKGDEFFKDWEGSEHVSPDRRTQLAGAYGKIKQDMAAAKDEFAPFLASAKDLESYLELDLSLKGVNAAGDLVQKAKDSGARVKSRIDAVLTQVNSVRGMLSTKS